MTRIVRVATIAVAVPLALVSLAAPGPTAAAQDVPIVGYTIDATGRAQISVESSTEHYYVLWVSHEPNGTDDFAVSMALGDDGTTMLTEQLAAYPQEHYRVTQHLRSAPDDLDVDRIDDVKEFEGFGRYSPFNPADEIPSRDGYVAIPDRETFEELSYEGIDVKIDKHLTDLQFVKFYLLDMHTDNPKTYFQNTQRYRSHGEFARAVGISRGSRPGRGDPTGTMRGEIVYHPHVVSPSGAMGVYRFEFEPNDNYKFADVQKGYETLAKNMPLLANDWAYYPMPNAALPRYKREKALYDASRIKIILEDDIMADVGYVPMNQAEGYGMLNVMELGERPHPRDVVIYEALPNELSRVAGIITTVPQTPLSHVNLRAIQDGVPNAYIREALSNPLIDNLLGKYVYYRVGAENYEIREATLEEVEAFYDAKRPTDPQVPVRDLDTTKIADLDDIGFHDWTGYGVKSANVATLRTFGFPEGTVRDGFAVPFYYYDEFMKHNGFYDDIRALLAEPSFQSDYEVQDDELKDLRKDINDGEMPEWMLDDLADMHAEFPEGMSIRTRSSTNNEDLPGFSGAGLYDSYTHHPDEGHMSKSIKQVYASLWNFRAFDERQFYRIDHFETAMGVLVHQSFDDEKANGVGVTTDPIYDTDDTFYLNTQVGENLVTNPEQQSVPEEILLGAADGSGYTVVRRSNQVPDGVQIMTDPYLDAIRGYLGVIDAEFGKLYGVADTAEFAMDIEYKITADDVLAIKQARPWVSDDSGAPVRPTPSATAVVTPSATPSVVPSETPVATPSATPDGPAGADTAFLPCVWRP